MIKAYISFIDKIDKLRKPVGLIFVVSALLFCSTSCFTVKYSTSGASISPEIKTVSVVYFTNRATLAPATISQQFTEKFRDKVRANTNLVLLNEGGDVNFEGEITGFSVSPTAISGNDVAARNRLTVTVHAKYTNSVDSKFSFDTSFSRFREFPSTEDLNSASGRLLPELLEELSEDVFNKAFVNW